MQKELKVLYLMKKFLAKEKPKYATANNYKCNFTKCLKNQTCDVIKIRKMRGEVGKKDMDNPSFL